MTSLRRQWEDAVLRAHGQTPTRTRGKLTAEARAAYQALNLHLHDLRREFACSLLESGAALHDVQAFLGHGNITTTSRYLQSAPVRLARALDRLEARAHGPESPQDDATPAAFAHGLHNREAEAPSAAPDRAPDKSRNVLN